MWVLALCVHASGPPGGWGDMSSCLSVRAGGRGVLLHPTVAVLWLRFSCVRPRWATRRTLTHAHLGSSHFGGTGMVEQYGTCAPQHTQSSHVCVCSVYTRHVMYGMTNGIWIGPSALLHSSSFPFSSRQLLAAPQRTEGARPGNAVLCMHTWHAMTHIVQVVVCCVVELLPHVVLPGAVRHLVVGLWGGGVLPSQQASGTIHKWGPGVQEMHTHATVLNAHRQRAMVSAQPSNGNGCGMCGRQPTQGRCLQCTHRAFPQVGFDAIGCRQHRSRRGIGLLGRHAARARVTQMVSGATVRPFFCCAWTLASVCWGLCTCISCHPKGPCCLHGAFLGALPWTVQQGWQAGRQGRLITMSATQFE